MVLFRIYFVEAMFLPRNSESGISGSNSSCCPDARDNVYS